MSDSNSSYIPSNTAHLAHTAQTALRAAVYARVSTLDQEPENQLDELRRYVQARGWSDLPP